MNLVLNLNQYDIKNVFFFEPIKNTIINEGIFIRILYSTNLMSSNGIYLLITLNDITCEKYYTKYKCNFDIFNNKNILQKIKNIEDEILEKYVSSSSKSKTFKIYEQIKTGCIKLFSNIENKIEYSFILKISGIWETESDYGLTFKFLPINNG